MKKTGKNKAIRAAAILAAAFMLLTFAGCSEVSRQRANFNRGVRLYDAGHLDEAKEKFALAGDYGTAAEFIQNIEECQKRLQAADESAEKHEYEHALDILKTLPKYDKADEKKAYIEGLSAYYTEAVNLFESGRHLEAKAKFILAEGYGDSAAYIAETDRMNTLYEEAKAFMISGNYTDAILKFREINAAFGDSAALTDECMRAVVQKPIKPALFALFYNDEYPDGSVKLNIGEENNSQFAVSDSMGILFTGVLDETGGITKLSVLISPQLAEKLSATGCKDAAARCIHAMNPCFMSFSELLSGLDGYLAGDKPYGLFRIGFKADNGGAIAVDMTFAEP